MNFKNIKIDTINEYNTFIFNNKDIKVLKYLPIEDKFNLIMTAIQKSNINGVYNPIRLKVFYNLNIVYLYTDIDFDIEDRVDEAALYDNLFTTGLLDLIYENIDEEELRVLDHMFEQCLDVEEKYRNTAAAVISKLIDDLPNNVEAAKEMVEGFDKDKYSEVVRFAKSINNGKLD